MDWLILGFHAFESEAKYIIIVEKDAIFKKIMEEKCFEVLDPFLLATGTWASLNTIEKFQFIVGLKLFRKGIS